MRFELEGEDARKKTVSAGKTSGRIFVPKGWEDRKVMVVLLEED